MAWAGVARRAAAELKMDERKKRPGGAEKLRLKKLKSLEVEAAKYSELTDLFGAGVTGPAGAAAPGDERVEAYMFCCRDPPVLRVSETVLYKQKVMYMVLVHSPANQECQELPLLSDDPTVCVYKNGRFIWSRF